jgi:hypothetical protein
MLGPVGGRVNKPEISTLHILNILPETFYIIRTVHSSGDSLVYHISVGVNCGILKRTWGRRNLTRAVKRIVVKG